MRLLGRWGERVDEDLPCIHCAYNLRTLRANARCPECGERVSDSLRNRVAKSPVFAYTAGTLAQFTAWAMLTVVVSTFILYLTFDFFSVWIFTGGLGLLAVYLGAFAFVCHDDDNRIPWHGRLRELAGGLPPIGVVIVLSSGRTAGTVSRMYMGFYVLAVIVPVWLAVIAYVVDRHSGDRHTVSRWMSRLVIVLSLGTAAWVIICTTELSANLPIVQNAGTSWQTNVYLLALALDMTLLAIAMLLLSRELRIQKQREGSAPRRPAKRDEDTLWWAD